MASNHGRSQMYTRSLPYIKFHESFNNSIISKVSMLSGGHCTACFPMTKSYRADPRHLAHETNIEAIIVSLPIKKWF